ncbi:MAG TPA: protease pro-enzyme activation domain-containing protein, partial [Polyangia bacterium]
MVLPLLIGCSKSAPIDTAASLPDRVQGAVDLGRLPADAQVDFVVGLSMRRPEALDRFLRTRAVGDVPLAPDEFADTFAPTAQDYYRVVSWLRAQGAFITRTATGRTTVSAYARADAVESLFAVELHQFSDADGSFFAAVGPLAVANDLVGTVNGVVGLSGSGGWTPHLSWPDLSAGAALAPADMEKLYGSAAITNPGMGETVAILGAGNPPDPTADIGDFMTHYHPYALTSAPSYSQTLLGGPTREDPSSASGEYIENVLDAEMVLSMAPLANIVHVLVATNSPGLFTDGISYIVNNVSKAHAVTVSFGGCERGAAQEMPVMNTLFEQAQAEGQQWFFASGDTGTDGCRDGAGNLHIAAGWPTSSPYIIGVGGTMIGNGGIEVTWNQ